MAVVRALEIMKREGQFCVVSEAGKNMGCYATREEADERLAEIERFARDEAGTDAKAEAPGERQLAIDLDEPLIDRAGAERAWLDLTREGDFAGYPTTDGRGIQITRSTLTHLLASIKRAETPIPVDGGGISAPHELVSDSGAPAAGWILDAVIMDDRKGRGHLWGWVELMPEVAAAISAGSLLYGSVAYDEGGIDHETGHEVGPTLHSYALTNKPFVPGLAPHRLDRETPGRYRVAASVEAARMLRAAQPEESTMSDIKPPAAQVVAPDTSAVDQLATKLAEAQAELVEMNAKLASYEVADAQRKAEEATRELSEQVELVCADADIRLSPEATGHLVALAEAKGIEAVRETIIAVNTPPVGVTMSAGTTPRRFASKEDAVRVLSEEVAKEMPEANEYAVMRETLSRMSKNQPELV